MSFRHTRRLPSVPCFFTSHSLSPVNLQACGVDSQVLNSATRLGFKSNIDSFCTLADASVMRTDEWNINLNIELIKPCKARSGLAKTRLTICAVAMAKWLKTRGRPFPGCLTLVFHWAIASSSIQKVSEPRLIRAWLYCVQLVVLSRGFGTIDE